MYYIYIVKLPKDEVYVGCTSNIRRRKDQHNENVRKLKGRFANYIKENYPNLILSQKDLNIIASFSNRNEALKYEKETAKKFIGKTILLNDNYNIDCSRKNKNLGKTSKSYVLIDIQCSTEIFITDLRQYCLKNNLDYKLVQRTVKGCKLSYQRYKVFYECDWLDITDKDYYLSGKFYKDHLDKIKQIQSQNYAKCYLVQTPVGEVIKVTNLDKYAKEHNLTPGTLHSTLSLGNSTKGYKVIKRI